MKRYQMSESLPVGLLLALAGGILDSYTFEPGTGIRHR